MFDKVTHRHRGNFNQSLLSENLKKEIPVKYALFYDHYCVHLLLINTIINTTQRSEQDLQVIKKICISQYLFQIKPIQK